MRACFFSQEGEGVGGEALQVKSWSESYIILEINLGVAQALIFPLFQLLVSFPTASEVRCVLEPWLKHVGFCLIYGSLALKTWR